MGEQENVQHPRTALIDAARTGRRGCARRALRGVAEAADDDRRGRRVVVEPLPRRTAVAAARAAERLPDRAVLVTLCQPESGARDVARAGVVVEALPAGAGVAAARRAGRAPDRSVVVELEQLAAPGDDRGGGGVVVEALPA